MNTRFQQNNSEDTSACVGVWKILNGKIFKCCCSVNLLPVGTRYIQFLPSDIDADGSVIYNIMCQSYDIICMKDVYLTKELADQIIDQFGLRGHRSEIIPFSVHQKTQGYEDAKQIMQKYPKAMKELSKH